jgi:hypothetical protein
MLVNTKTVGTVVAGVALLVGGVASTASAAVTPPPSRTAPAAAASLGACKAGHLCIWTGIKFTGTMWATPDAGYQALPGYMVHRDHSYFNDGTGCIFALAYTVNGRSVAWVPQYAGMAQIPSNVATTAYGEDLVCSTYSVTPRRNSVSNLRPKLIRS